MATSAAWREPSTQDTHIGVSHRFQVSVGEYDLGGWTSVDGLSFDTDVMEIKEGGVNTFQAASFGRLKWKRLKLVRAVQNDDWTKTAAYIISSLGRPYDAAASVATMTIKLFSAWNQPIQEYTVTGVRCVSWSGPKLDASKGAAATETIEFWHEGLSLAAAPGAAALTAPLHRGHLVKTGGSGAPEMVKFHYNPENVKVTKSSGATGQNPFGTSSSGGGAAGSPAHSAGPSSNTHDAAAGGHTGGGRPATTQNRGNTLSFKLIFDGQFLQDVSRFPRTLRTWMDADTSSPSDRSNPSQAKQPVVELFLGETKWLSGTINQVVTTYDLFSPVGFPTRATCEISMQEVGQSLDRQNPSSGGLTVFSSATVAAGDTLQSIATREYGHPRLWRALADVNDIDDPLRVRPGTTLVLPALSDLVERA